jgi:gluconolactonase
MKKTKCIERLLGFSILLCSCGEKADVSHKKEEGKVAEVNASAMTPENLTCQVELHDPNLEMVLDGSVKLQVLAEGFEIAEGPLWIPSMKTLLFTDVKGNKIHQWSEEKESDVFLSPGGHTGRVPFFEGGVLGPNGLALDTAGNLIICQHGDRRLAKLAFDNITQEGLSTLTATYEGKRFNSPNDLTIAANGDIYFTDPPYGHCDIANSVPGEGMVFVDDKREIPYCGIYRYQAATSKVSLVNNEMDLPNGIALSPDQKWIYVGSSDMKDPKMWRFSAEDGSGGVFFEGPYGEADAGWFDGMKMHSSGNLFATGPGGLLVISPEGKKLATIRLPDPITNCCFDENEEYLYVTAFAYVARFKLKG